jgi:triphosphatase
VSEELELKFAIAERTSLAEVAEIALWLDRIFPPGAGERWRELEISDRYFDTPGGALAASGHGARLRQIGDRTTLTVKQDIDVRGGLHRRLELEAPASGTLRPTDWPPSRARARIESVVGRRRLIERFVVHQQRRERRLRLPEAVVLLSIDEARVEVAGWPAGELRQLEAELADGDPAVMRLVGRRIGRNDLLKAEPRSKLTIAAGLAEGAAAVRADDELAEAGRKVLRRQLLRMLEREEAVRAGEPLAIKQMRVATRRQRAVWRLLDFTFARALRRRYVTELRAVARALGEVRDLDVLIASLSTTPPLAALVGALRDRRSACFERLVAMLDSERYGSFVDDYLGAVGGPGMGSRRQRARARARVGEAAPALVEDAYQRVFEAGGAVDEGAETTAWHALRIAARRFRYTIEIFGDVVEPARLTGIIEPLTRLQDLLGGMNDASVAAGEVERWLQSAGDAVSAAERAAAERFIAGRRKLIARSRHTFASAWRRVAAKAYRRRLKAALRAI